MIRHVGLAAALTFASIGGSISAAPPLTAEAAGTAGTAGASAPVDPARQAIATRLAAQLVPEGAFRRMMGGAMKNVTNAMFDRMMDIPIRDLAGLTGVDPAKLKAMGPGTLDQAVTIIDPAFHERMQIATQITMSSLIDVMATMEPSMREGMAAVYAKRFSLDQLNDLERFFNSPTGRFYASQSIEMSSDPALTERMRGMMPKMLQAMPKIAQDIEAATAGLPKPRTASDLTVADKQKLARLFGTDSKEAK